MLHLPGLVLRSERPGDTAAPPPTAADCAALRADVGGDEPRRHSDGTCRGAVRPRRPLLPPATPLLGVPTALPTPFGVL